MREEQTGPDPILCERCQKVSYCSKKCKKKHWEGANKESGLPNCHEAWCIQTPAAVQERKRAAIIIPDEALFKEPPTRGDCPICFLRLPCASQCNYQTCCGKEICNGCIHAFIYEIAKTECPFCREPCHDTDEEGIVRIKKRMDAKDGAAFHMLAFNYLNGTMSLPQDTNKSFDLWVRATELGKVDPYNSLPDAQNSLANSYANGRGVEIDEKKAEHYRQLAAMGGHPIARYNLGYTEEVAGIMSRALKHYMIAARGGFDPAMEKVRLAFSRGLVSKDEFEKTLRAHKDYLDEVKSEQRDKAGRSWS